MKKQILISLSLILTLTSLTGCKSKKVEEVSKLIEVKGYDGFGMVDTTRYYKKVINDAHKYMSEHKDNTYPVGAIAAYKMALEDEDGDTARSLENGEKVKIQCAYDGEIRDKGLKKAVPTGNFKLDVKGLKKIPKSIDISKNNEEIQKELDYSFTGLNGFGNIYGDTYYNTTQTTNYGSVGIDLSMLDMVKLNGKPISKYIKGKKRLNLTEFEEIKKLHLKNGDKLTLSISDDCISRLESQYNCKIKGREGVFKVKGLVDIKEVVKNSKKDIEFAIRHKFQLGKNKLGDQVSVESLYIKNINNDRTPEFMGRTRNIEVDLGVFLKIKGLKYDEKTKDVKPSTRYLMDDMLNMVIYKDKGKYKMIPQYESNDVTEREGAIEETQKTVISSETNKNKEFQKIFKNTDGEVYEIYPKVKLLKK